MLGSIYGKHHWYQRRIPIDVNRFVEIHWDYKTKQTYLEDIQIVGSVWCKSIDRNLYSINTATFIPPRCKMGYPFEVFYDEVTHTCYAAPQDCGLFRFMVDNMPVELNGGDIIGTKNDIIHGKTPLVCAETFGADE